VQLLGDIPVGAAAAVQRAEDLEFEERHTAGF
jgi:hypothetical protein